MILSRSRTGLVALSLAVAVLLMGGWYGYAMYTAQISPPSGASIIYCPSSAMRCTQGTQCESVTPSCPNGTVVVPGASAIACGPVGCPGYCWECVVDDGGNTGGEGDLCEPICGDGIVVGGEECDDGNTRNGDGCSSACRSEGRSSAAASRAGGLCGNGIANAGEQCGEPGLQCGAGIACGGAGILGTGDEYIYDLKFGTDNTPCGTVITNKVIVTGKVGGTVLRDVATLTTTVACGGGLGTSSTATSAPASAASSVAATCYDSDVEDMRNAGSIIVSGTRLDDVCAQDIPPTEFWSGTPGSVLEAVCLGPNSPFRRQVVCPNGYSCSNGACTVVETSAGTCVDTDGGINLAVRGTVSDPASGGATFLDSCSASDPSIVIEQYCSNIRHGQLSNSTVSAQIRCPQGTTCLNGACQ